VIANPIDNISKIKHLQGVHIGEVVDNEDPEQLGRIRVMILDLFEGLAPDELPWMYVMHPVGIGGSPYSSFSGIPENKTQVVCSFPQNDIYHGTVIGILVSQRTRHDDRHSKSGGKCQTGKSPNPANENDSNEAGLLPNKCGCDTEINDTKYTSPLDVCNNVDFNEDYPESYGWVDRLMNFLKINKKKKEVTMHHSSGSFLKIDEKGNVNIKITGNLKVVIEKDSTTQIEGNKDEVVFKDWYRHLKGKKDEIVDKRIKILNKDTIDTLTQKWGKYHYNGNIDITSSKQGLISMTSTLTLKGSTILEN